MIVADLIISTYINNISSGVFNLLLDHKNGDQVVLSFDMSKECTAA